MCALRARVAVLVASGLALAGCTSGEREWRVAADQDASAAEIIEAGHPADIAVNGDQLVVTWEVEPEDDEGPYQGAWRLYDRTPLQIAEGKFGTVYEASGRIYVTPVSEGFLLTDYVKHRMHFLDQKGKLTPATLRTARPGSSLAGGVLLESSGSEEPGWQVLLPATRQVVPLTSLPSEDVQGVGLTADGTVWVLLPWTDDGPFRVAHAKDGNVPWTTETIPLPKGTATGGDGFSASGEQLFVVASRDEGDISSAVEVILSRSTDETEWMTIDATGIADNLTSAPKVTFMLKDHLLATSSGEGSWIRDPDEERWRAVRPPRAQVHSRPTITSEGAWLWSAEQNLGNSLHYSHNRGRTWREFDR